MKGIMAGTMKGAMKTIEAIMGGLIILLFLAALNATNVQVTSPGPAHGDRVLLTLHGNDDFRGHVSDMNVSAIDSMASATGYLTGFNHTVRICDESGSCTGVVPEKENVWGYSIVMSGDETYDPAEVTLYAFRDG
jgi:hypothetical protein